MPKPCVQFLEDSFKVICEASANSIHLKFEFTWQGICFLVKNRLNKLATRKWCFGWGNFVMASLPNTSSAAQSAMTLWNGTTLNLWFVANKKIHRNQDHFQIQARGKNKSKSFYQVFKLNIIIIFVTFEFYLNLSPPTFAGKKSCNTVNSLYCNLIRNGNCILHSTQAMR